MLVGEHVSWKDDFVHVDEAAVRNTGNKGAFFVFNFNSFSLFTTASFNLFKFSKLDLFELGLSITFFKLKVPVKNSTCLEQSFPK